MIEKAAILEETEVSVGSYTPADKRSVNILSIDGEERSEKVESLTLSFSTIYIKNRY